MPLEIQTSTPTVDGRYVVYTPCAALQIRKWCEPHIATWHGGKWIFGDPVWGWIGPLPLVHGDDCLEQFQVRFGSEIFDTKPFDLKSLEYDL